MATIGIYKITSPSGKIYIGQSQNIGRRFITYKTNGSCFQPVLKNSLKKHGYDNHKFEIVEICDIESLNKRERYWQDYYDACNPKKGLNSILVNTDDKVRVFSEEMLLKMSERMKKNNPMKMQYCKDKISKALKGRVFTPEWLKKNSDAQKNRSDEVQKRMTACRVYKPHSEETKLKISIGVRKTKSKK